MQVGIQFAEKVTVALTALGMWLRVWRQLMHPDI